MANKKVGLIVGGAVGIGRAIVLALAKECDALVFTYHHSRKEAMELSSTLKHMGITHQALKLDIRSVDEIRELFSIIKDSYGNLAILINNSGTTGGKARCVDATQEQIDEVFTTNFRGTFFCCQEFLRQYDVRGTQGVIVNISSTAARTGGAFEWVHYASSKAAINTLTKGLADEAAELNIRVVAVSPGLVASDLHARNGEPGRPDRLLPTVPLRRIGRPEEIASLVAFICSLQSSYITGTSIDVSGGR